MKFFEKWDKLENSKAKVILKHMLFGRQMHNCNSLQIINDHRLGLILKGQEIFMDKEAIKMTEVQDNMYMVSDGTLTIAIIL